jgi:hypothetical protein
LLTAHQLARPSLLSIASNAIASTSDGSWSIWQDVGAGAMAARRLIEEKGFAQLHSHAIVLQGDLLTVQLKQTQ